MGCASIPSVAVNPRYRAEKLDGRILHVLPIPHLDLQASAPFEREFGKEGGDSSHPEPIFNRLFGAGFMRTTDHVLLQLDSTWAVSDSLFKDTLLPLPGKDAGILDTFARPTDSLIREKGAGDDLILALSNVKIGFGSLGHWEFEVPDRKLTFIKRKNGSVKFTGAKHRRSIKAEGRFLIWDCRAGEPLAYGRFSGTDAYESSLTRRVWERAVDFSIQSMIEDTPLRGAKYEKAIHPPPNHLDY
jgi:hypothetical protein